MHLALYRSERPERFEEIIGQKHIVKILRNQIKKGTVSQSYLFAGTRGTGKTTTARILAKAVNCTCSDPGVDLPCGECANCRAITEGRFLDVVELDAASNNGVESLRQITESVQYPPTVGKYKVYIIDEAHMLTDSAENAFLKTLEEPPAHVIFILATTNPEKIKAENHISRSISAEASQSGTPKEEPQATNAYEKQVQPRPNASAERAQDVEEPQPLFEQKFNPLEGAPPDRHIVEFEANQNLDEMWDRICDQMARTDAMFMAMVAKYTRLVDLHGSELTVEVKKTKSLMADDALGELNRITKALYGDKFYIAFRVVEYNPADARELSQAEEPGVQRFDEELIDAAEEKDEIAKEVAKDVADFFGVDKIDIK